MNTLADVGTPYHQDALDPGGSSLLEAEEWRVDILPYAPHYREDFQRLNLEWISHYFWVEPLDTLVLSDPETYFLRPGGAIFMARATCCAEVVGTCALLKHPDHGFELAKMGVTCLYRGMHIGQRLVETALAHAKALGARHVFLDTSAKLIPANHLYKKLGFTKRPFPGGCSKRYQRADTYMVLEW